MLALEEESENHESHKETLSGDYEGTFVSFPLEKCLHISLDK